MMRNVGYLCEDKPQCSLTQLPWQHHMDRICLIRYRCYHELRMCELAIHASAFVRRLTWVVHRGCQVRKMLRQSF